MARHRLLIIVSAVVVFADQVSKQLVLKVLFQDATLEVIPGLFSLTHVRNTGGAFGLFAGQASRLRTVGFLVISCFALGILWHLYRSLAGESNPVRVAFALILAGAIGNMIDRFRFGEVIDFLDFHIGVYHWPAFNVADSAIVVGVGVLLVSMIRKRA